MAAVVAIKPEKYLRCGRMGIYVDIERSQYAARSCSCLKRLCLTRDIIVQLRFDSLIAEENRSAGKDIITANDQHTRYEQEYETKFASIS